MRKKPKADKLIDDIVEVIYERFTNKSSGKVDCGIIYCLSKAECEDVAEKLNGHKQTNGRPLRVRY